MNELGSTSRNNRIPNWTVTKGVWLWRGGDPTGFEGDDWKVYFKPWALRFSPLLLAGMTFVLKQKESGLESRDTTTWRHTNYADDVMFSILSSWPWIPASFLPWSFLTVGYCLQLMLLWWSEGRISIAPAIHQLCAVQTTSVRISLLHNSILW